jgi:hypothetical protein
MRITLIVVLLFSFPAFASKLGLGISLGNPTGLNGKYWLNEGRAVDAGVGWSIGRNSNFSLYSDYLLHQKSALYLNDTRPLDFYYGIGGRMEFADDIELGVRLPIGIAHELDDQAADIFAELAPIVDFLGRTGIEAHILFGARYFF